MSRLPPTLSHPPLSWEPYPCQNSMELSYDLKYFPELGSKTSVLSMDFEVWRVGKAAGGPVGFISTTSGTRRSSSCRVIAEIWNSWDLKCFQNIIIQHLDLSKDLFVFKLRLSATSHSSHRTVSNTSWKGLGVSNMVNRYDMAL